MQPGEHEEAEDDEVGQEEVVDPVPDPADDHEADEDADEVDEGLLLLGLGEEGAAVADELAGGGDLLADGLVAGLLLLVPGGGLEYLRENGEEKNTFCQCRTYLYSSS